MRSRRAGMSRPSSTIRSHHPSSSRRGTMRATGRPRSVMVITSPAAARRTTALACAFSSRMPTSSWVPISAIGTTRYHHTGPQETTSNEPPPIAYRGVPRPLCYRRVVRAVYAARFGGDDPLANLAIGDRPHPRAAAGWALVRVTAASLNHHDLWTLRGVSSQPLNAPQILGCDAVGRVEELGEGSGGALAPGTRVVVHSVIGCGACPACLAPETGVCHRLSLLGEPPHRGALAQLVAVPAAN